MADITVSEIGITASTEFKRGVSSEAIARGKSVYRDSQSGSKWGLADATGANARVAGEDESGVALTSTEADGDYLIVAVGGDIRIEATGGATVVVEGRLENFKQPTRCLPAIL